MKGNLDPVPLNSLEEKRRAFVAFWKTSGLAPVEAAERLGLDLALALAWAREEREESLSRFLHRALRLAAEAGKRAEDPRRLPPSALLALSRLSALVPLLEDAWQEALNDEEERRSSLSTPTPFSPHPSLRPTSSRDPEEGAGQEQRSEQGKEEE